MSQTFTTRPQRAARAWTLRHGVGEDRSPGDPITITDHAHVVVRARDGDPEAFERLVALYEARLLRTALTLLSDRGDAEDAVQDILLLVWTRLPTLKEPRAFYAWVHQLATRRCLDILRSRARRPAEPATDLELEVHHPHRRGPEDAFQTAVELKNLERVLTTLSEEQRTSWVLKEVHGLSYPEIADAVGAPVSTVRGRLARARRHLTVGMESWR